MLVLSRRRDERIVLGSNIEVIVIQVRSKRVKLGIIAPDKVSIQRAELLREVERQKTDKLVRPCNHV